jgi:hypothetical protein
MRIQLRAFFAAAGACALIFALLMSAVARPALARSGGSPGVTCHMAQNAMPDAAHTGGGGDQSDHIRCPCCLATHAAPAVLPERLATVTRPMRVVVTPAHYLDLSSPEPKTTAPGAVNGARAPPALLQTI